MIKDRLEWIPLTIYAIFRNKRRSFAMISGIILGITILTGILIYSSVLKQQNFESVVNNAPYEIRFDILDNETVGDLNELASLIKDDIRVADSTIIGKEPVSNEFSYVPSILFEGEEEVDINNFGPGPAVVSPIFIQNNYFDTQIGRKFSTNVEGSFNLADGNKTLISRATASKHQYEVGDIISSMNITYTKIVSNGQKFDTDKFEGYLTNITVVGIYEEGTSNAGIFGDIFAIEEVYMSIDILDFLPNIKKAIIEDKGYFLAVKIDVTQFSVDDPELMNNEINKFINYVAEIGDTRDFEVSGFNEIALLLLPFQISSFFITLFDVLLAAPVVILSLYLLFFGIEMSLEERRREIAIKKVQGADSKQIFSELRNEAVILFLIGSFIGYIFGIIGAWIISSAIGFMKINIGTQEDFINFFTIDLRSILWATGIVGIILLMQVIRQGKAFIEAEVSEAVQKFQGIKESFVKRNKIDIILLLIGVAGIITSLLEHQFDVDLNLNFFLSILINGLGPFFLWIGGALVGARITKYIPMRLERVFLGIPSFRDISKIISSGLKKRGDTDRLAIIIVLTLSIATLAAAQGNTEHQHVVRNIEWEIGADMQVSFSNFADYSSKLTPIDGIDDVLAVSTSEEFRVLSSSFRASSIDIEKEYRNLKEGNTVAIWHEDSFYDLSPEEALKKLSDNPYGVFVSRGTLNLLNANVGDKIKIKVQILNDKDASSTPIEDVEILGTFDHAPGGIIGQFLTTDKLVLRINSLANGRSIKDYDILTLNSSKYLVRTTYGESITPDQINSIKSSLAQLLDYQSSRLLYQELNSDQTKIGTFGVSGLLSLNFLVSVSASLISTFAFSTIIMERRKREFAVLRAIGARKSQIYKLAIGENTMMVLTAVLWGSIIGLGITYQFNGVFELFGVFLGGGPLNRIVEFPVVQISLIGLFTTIGMLLATMISVRSAANQDLSTATRVI